MSYNSDTGLWEGFIYKIYNTNGTTNKVYIGQTTTTLQQRFRKHQYRSRSEKNVNSALSKAFEKYGYDNFDICLLESIVSNNKDALRKELNDSEVYYISKYNSYNNGYNLTPGANLLSNLGKPVSQWDLDGKHIADYESSSCASQQTGVLVSHIRECCLKIYKSAGGYLWTNKGETTTLNQRLKYRKINQYSMYDGELIATWNSIKEASDNLNIKSGSITACCQGKYLFAGNFVWRYLGDDYDKYETPDNTLNILKYSKDGSILLDSYRNVVEASKTNNIHKALIYRALKGGRPSAGGFTWKYAV